MNDLRSLRRVPGAAWLTSAGSDAGGPSTRIRPAVGIPESSAAGDWLRQRLVPWGRHALRVHSFIPTGFQAYCRIFHPAARYVDASWVHTTWAEVARSQGQTPHPAMQWEEIAPPDADDQIAEPRIGWLSGDSRSAIVDALRDTTTTPDQYYVCVWEGMAGIGDAYPELPRVVHPHRSYMLFEVDLNHLISGVYEGGGAESFGFAFWWPADRAWCVTSEIDHRWSYVGGPELGISRLLADARVEALRAELTDRADPWSDTVN